MVRPIEIGIQRVVDHPLAWSLVDEEVRRHVVNRFPYCIYYIIDEQTILILAIFHTKRKPDIWKQRSRTVD